ncbi:MAG: hypothetical protein QXZ24_03105 [Candidatus Jordarchaeales archaeon]
MRAGKMLLTAVVLIALFSSVFTPCEFYTGAQLLYITVSSSHDADVKSDLIAYRGEPITLLTRAYDSNGSPAANVIVTLYDETNNKSILSVKSNGTGYAVFYWIIPKDYPLGETTIRFIAVNVSYTAIPSSVVLKIISRASIEVISYPTSVFVGSQYSVTFCLKDNLKNPIPNQLVYLYFDDMLVAVGRTNGSDTQRLLFVVPKLAAPGMHNLTIEYLGSETYSPASLTLEVEVVPKVENPVITRVSLNKSIVKPGASIKVTVETNGTVGLVTINGTSMLNVSVSLWEAVIVAPQAQGNYTLQICAVGNGRECFATVNIYVDATPPRVIAYISNPTPRPGEPIKVIVEAVDETGVTVVRVNGVNAYRNGEVWTLSLNAPSKEGTYSLNIAAVDMADNIATTSITYNVVSNGNNAGGVPDITLEHLYFILQLFYLNGMTAEPESNRLLFACTSALCALILAAALRKPRDLKVLDDLASFDSLT